MERKEKQRRSCLLDAGTGKYAAVGTFQKFILVMRIVYSIGTSQKGSIMHFIQPNWWQYTKYILFRNHSVTTPGHLYYRTVFRQRLKQNLFSSMSTWQMMYVSIPGRQPASWLGSIYHWSRSCRLPILNTQKVFAVGGSSHAPGCWHPCSSCCLHYSFFTDVELW